MAKYIDNKVNDLRKEIVSEITNDLRNSGRVGCEFDGMMITNRLSVGGCYPLMYLQMARLNKNGDLVLDVEIDGDSDITTINPNNVVEDIMTDCLHDILSGVESAISIRSKILSEMREIVAKCGGRISFDGGFTFCGYDGSEDMYECENTKLLGLSLNGDGGIVIEDEWDGGKYTNSERFFRDTELSRIIEYVRNQSNVDTELRKQIRTEVMRTFADWLTASDIESMAESIIDDCVEDVKVCSDYPHYNDDDVRIAIQRVILNRVIGE